MTISGRARWKDSLRYQAWVAAVEAGAIPGSALYEMDDSNEEDAIMGEERGMDGQELDTTYALSSPRCPCYSH